MTTAASLQVCVTQLSDATLSKLVHSDSFERSRVFNAIFKRIAHHPWSLLLDTSGSQQSDGRYNIMAFAPSLTVTATKGNVYLTDENGTQCVPETPFEATRKYLHSKVVNTNVISEKNIDDLPFVIGVAGMAGYDAGRFYEALPSVAKDDYETPDFAVGLYLYSIIEDTHTGNFYYCSCDGSSYPDFIDISTDGFSNSEQDVGQFKLTSPFSSNLSKPQYTECIDKIHHYLKAGDCYQVNMAQRFSARFEGDVWEAYCELRNQNSAPFSAFFRTPLGCVASISPERFLRVKNGKVETKPIKGTRPRYKDSVKDAQSASSLLNAEKDRAENLMIVDLLRNDISKHCKAHSVEVPALFALESYKAVHHLVSTVVGELEEGTSPLTLLASAFPGGSITGAPKIRAMEVIDELEPHRRNIYCGSIFYMGFREDMDSSICIRTVLAENNTLHCWAGGGIVLDSSADDEYQETLDKVSKIVPVLTALNK